ncbi:centromere protein H-like [Ptychodera flava]|uniref:centromere protein H-like n=1 Tax=Ptychodera flava TaxID=63121 RepID=UPI003969D6BC
MNPRRKALEEITQQNLDSHGVLESPSRRGPSSETDNTSETLDLIRKKDWLRNQKLDHKAVLASAALAPSSNDIEKLDESIANLKVDLFELSIEHSLKERKLQSAQCAALLKEFLSKDSEGGLFNENEKQNVSEMCKKQSELSSEILERLKETEDLQKELDETKKQCLEMKKSNRELMLQIQEKQSATDKEQQRDAESEEITRIKEELDELTTKISLVRGVFQGVVVGSGVNWAEDPDLAETVIALGQPIDD